MRLNVLLLICLSLCSVNRVEGQAFQKQYFTTDVVRYSYGAFLTDTSRQCFLGGGVTDSVGTGLAMKINPDGTVNWSKQIYSVNPDYQYNSFYSLCETSDGGLIFLGEKDKNGNQSGSVAFKLDQNGTLQWSKSNPGSIGLFQAKACASGDQIYFGEQFAQSIKGNVSRFVYLGKVANSGAVQWQKLLETGHMDVYNINTMLPDAEGNIVLCLQCLKFLPNNAGFDLGHTIIVRISPAGELLQAAYFPHILLSSLVLMPNGNFGFACNESNSSWTGIGILDHSFTSRWFKKITLAHGSVVSSGIQDHQVSISADGSRLYATANCAGGEKLSIGVDTLGNPVSSYVFFGISQFQSTGKAKGFVRGSNAGAGGLIITWSDDDGNPPNCFFPKPCGLVMTDSIIVPQSIEWAITDCTSIQAEQAVTSDVKFHQHDHCFDPGPVNAGFSPADTLICPGDRLDFLAAYGHGPVPFGSSRWHLEGGDRLVSNSPVVKDVQFNLPGTFTIAHYFNLAGCEDTVYHTVRVLPFPVSMLGRDTTLCQGDTLVLTAGTDTSLYYLWNNGKTSLAQLATAINHYAVTISNAAGCEVTDSILVAFLSPGTVSLGHDTLICPGTVIHLKPEGAFPTANYSWNTGSAEPLLDVNQPGEYNLTVRVANCATGDSISIGAADCKECSVYIPNVFNPESAQSNNLFRIFPGCSVTSGRIWIYDRWGDLIFKSDDPLAPWDGRHLGRPMPAGVYLYHAELDLKPDYLPSTTKKISGSITLIR